MDLASSTIFVTEEAEPDIMKKRPQKMKDILGKSLVYNIMKNGVALAFGILIIYLHVYYQYTVTMAQTAALVAWLLGHILLALNLKQEKKPLLIQGIFSNGVGFGWLCAMIVLSGIITYVPVFYPYLKTAWLPVLLWIEILVIFCISTFWIEAKN